MLSCTWRCDIILIMSDLNLRPDCGSLADLRSVLLWLPAWITVWINEPSSHWSELVAAAAVAVAMAAAASSWVFTPLNTRHMNVAAQQCFKIKFHFSFLQLFSVKLNIHRFKHESPVCYVPLRHTCPLWCVHGPSHFSKVTVSWWNMLFLYKDANMNVKINDCFLKMKKICVLRMNLLLKMNILGVFF